VNEINHCSVRHFIKSNDARREYGREAFLTCSIEEKAGKYKASKKGGRMKNAVEPLPRIEDFVKRPTFSVKGPIGRSKSTDQIFVRAGHGEVDIDTRGVGPSSPPPHPLDRVMYAPCMLRAHLWKIREPKPLKWKVEVPDKAKMSAHIKETARYLGADLVGITRLHQEFVFENDRSGEPIDASNFTHAIIVAKAMDYDRIQTTPSWCDHVEVGKRYQEEGVLTTTLAIYIAELGYRARASFAGADSVLYVPLAVYAGLGELSRIGIMLTKQYGPRVRLGAVLTDLPLEIDHPIDLNVGSFCESCKKCATNCPTGAIAAKEKTEVKGVMKWKVNEVACYRYWRKDPMNWQDCIRCVAVCPWNKPNTSFHRGVAGIVSNYPSSHKAINFMDDLFYGKKPKRKDQPASFNDYRMTEEQYMQMIQDPEINIKFLAPEKH
jgi:reductive dehalogenase